jgi:hypothetical protein
LRNHLKIRGTRRIAAKIEVKKLKFAKNKMSFMRETTLTKKAANEAKNASDKM